MQRAAIRQQGAGRALHEAGLFAFYAHHVVSGVGAWAVVVWFTFALNSVLWQWLKRAVHSFPTHSTSNRTNNPNPDSLSQPKGLRSQELRHQPGCLQGGVFRARPARGRPQAVRACVICVIRGRIVDAAPAALYQRIPSAHLSIISHSTINPNPNLNPNPNSYQAELAAGSPIRLLDLQDMTKQVPLPAPPPGAAPPRFVLGGSIDNVVDVEAVEELARYCGVGAVVVPGLAHDCMLDTQWRVVAEALEGWLGGIEA